MKLATFALRLLSLVGLLLATTACYLSGYPNHLIPKLTNPNLIATGDNHACTVDEGQVVCWSSNQRIDHGEKLSFADGLSTPTVLSAGKWETCLINDTGVHCTEGLSSSVPTLSDPKDLSVGGRFACALDGGEVLCWGQGEASIPPNNMSLVTEIAAGLFHACALSDGEVRCWGEQDQGAHTHRPHQSKRIE